MEPDQEILLGMPKPVCFCPGRHMKDLKSLFSHQIPTPGRHGICADRALLSGPGGGVFREPAEIGKEE